MRIYVHPVKILRDAIARKTADQSFVQIASKRRKSFQPQESVAFSRKSSFDFASFATSLLFSFPSISFYFIFFPSIFFPLSLTDDRVRGQFADTWKRRV